jgi:glutathione S-transferase
MKLYSSIGPNPRIVRMFAAEKGAALEIEEIDILAGINRQEPYLSVNPQGTTPALILDDGEAVTEVLAACEYLEELYPAPALIGSTPEERVRVRTWARKIDLGFALPITLAFRASGGRAMFAPRIIVAPEAAAPDLYAMAFDMLDYVERTCGDGDYVAGEAYSVADILLFCFVEFGKAVGIDVTEGRPWLTGWHGRVAARPAAAA